MRPMMTLLAILFVAGCAAPTHTRLVEVRGASATVAAFVADEQTRTAAIQVSYLADGSKAVLSAPSATVQDQMRLRATRADLAVTTTTKFSWSSR